MAISTVAQVQSVGLTSAHRKPYARTQEVLELPNLIQVQTDSFEWFLRDGLRELFEEITPISDFTGRNLELHLMDHVFGEPKYGESECRERDMTFSRPLRVRTRLIAKESGEVKEQEIFMGDFPMMTETGTFVINGAERVVVSQLVRSPGVYLTLDEDATTGRMLCYGKLIPSRGAWLEFETSNKDVLSVKVDRKRKIPVTTLLRAMGYATNEEIRALFPDAGSGERDYIGETLAKDPSKTVNEALLEVYRRLRPGDPPTVDNAKNLIESLFRNYRRYDLGRVGRYKVNKRLSLTHVERTLKDEDLIEIIRTMIKLNLGKGLPDDIDHLGNRRVRAVGELIQAAFRIGLLRMERVVKERMSIQDPETATPAALINIRPIVAAMKEFFGGSQLSQFMDQTNPLAELTHKRRLSALGPGGLNRERAGMDVRDVHHSHYGRICPIETPEGPNIGLIGSMATFARINEYGFIETPYRKVRNAIGTAEGADAFVHRTLRERVVDQETGEVLAESGTLIDSKLASAIAALPARDVKVKAFVTLDIAFQSADTEDLYSIAQANSALDEYGNFVDERIEVRRAQDFVSEAPERVQFMDVSPKQIVSPATSLIPFLEHDDANRALMGSNMQRQAVPLLRPEAPIVGTGVERQTARDSGQVLLSKVKGEVTQVNARSITIQDAEKKLHVHKLIKFLRSNQGTCINQRPIVDVGDKVTIDQPLADSSSTQQGELALGQNVLAAFMSWEGYNFEDAIILSQRLVKEDKFTSIHIEKHEVESRDTKLGPEEITRDIPNVGDEALKDLDERGIIRVGAEVGPGDILVGKITPKGETELTAEERLLRAIFGEKAREVKDTSLRVPHGERGKVVDVRIFSRENHDELPAGVNQLVRVSMAQKRKISEGDKMAGRHGNKGVISRIMPEEDMPFLADGTPVDIVLNPIGVPSRMNVGQILETHLGWAASVLGFRVETPVFDGATEDRINEEIERARTKLGLRPDDEGEPAIGQRLKPGEFDGKFGKFWLRDGRTGNYFDQPITVGQMYMLKLVHLVEDKIHARSTGPYSLITQQPLGGKAQFGGQRFGEMEVWALEAYGASHILQEILTVKSDDVVGRVKTYEAIVKGDAILEPGVPESFKVLVKELQSLGLSVEVLNEDEESIRFAEETAAQDDLLPELGIKLTGQEFTE